MEFRKGDRVRVVDGGVQNPGTEGKAGTVFYQESEADGLIAVKGIDGRLAEWAKGYRTYSPEQLRRV